MDIIIIFTGWSLFEYVIFCTFLWWASYFFLVILSKQSEEWACRLLTFIHGCVVSLSAIWDLIVNREDMALQNVPLTNEQKGYLSFSLSYFSFDYLWILLFGNDIWVIHVHHIVGILIITKVMMYDFGGIGVSIVIIGLECTNPYLQARWFLRTYGYNHKPIHTFCELWFFFMFFMIRMIGGTIFLFYTWNFADDLIIKVLITCIYVISVILAWDISKYIKKKYWDKRMQLHTSNRGNPEQSEVDLQNQND